MADVDLAEAATRGKGLVHALRHEIMEGAYAPHSRFLSYRELCRRYGATLHTVRKALDTLVSEGLLYRHERSGTFVRGNAVGQGVAGEAGALKCVNFVQARQPLERQRFQVEYLTGYTQALEDHDLKVRFLACPEPGCQESAFGELLSTRFPLNEQGCVFGDCVPAEVMAWLRRQSVPFVVHNYAQYPSDGLPPHHRVYVNKVGGSFDAIRALIDLGHRRIGICSADPSPLYEGYVAALRTSGMEALPELRSDTHTDTPGTTVAAMRAFLRRTEGMTALLAGTDSGAMDALQAAKELGLRVPEQLSIIGYGDIPEAVETDPPLAAISPHRRHLAREAVEMLLQAADAGFESWLTRVLPCRIVMRPSVGPAGCALAKTLSAEETQ